MYKGEVVQFSGAKGFGFLSRSDGGKDVFCHWSAIVSDEKYKTLCQGDQVTFDITEGPKGLPQAANVRVVKAATVVEARR